jgi:hypothetical protein
MAVVQYEQPRGGFGITRFIGRTRGDSTIDRRGADGVQQAAIGVDGAGVLRAQVLASLWRDRTSVTETDAATLVYRQFAGGAVTSTGRAVAGRGARGGSLIGARLTCYPPVSKRTTVIAGAMLDRAGAALRGSGSAGRAAGGGYAPRFVTSAVIARGAMDVRTKRRAASVRLSPTATLRSPDARAAGGGYAPRFASRQRHSRGIKPLERNFSCLRRPPSPHRPVP